MDDDKIVELYLSRDESAISETAAKYGLRLRRIAERILDDPAAAEECENETYLRAWGLVPPNEPRAYLFPFLGRITRHIAIDEYRKSASARRRGLICELTDEMAECLPSRGRAEEGAEADDLRRDINSFLETCTEQQRCVFVRRYWYFDSISEIGRRYGFSQSKVKTILFRLREGLRSHLEKEGYTI